MSKEEMIIKTEKKKDRRRSESISVGNISSFRWVKLFSQYYHPLFESSVTALFFFENEILLSRNIVTNVT